MLLHTHQKALTFYCIRALGEEGEWEDVEEEEVMIGGNADDIAMEMEPEQQVRRDSFKKNKPLCRYHRNTYIYNY